MGDDWQVGDVARCVKLGGKGGRVAVEVLPSNLRIGGFYTVNDVFFGENTDGFKRLGLGLVEAKPVMPGAIGFDAELFRKVRPHTPDAEDIETIRLLTGAPALQPVVAGERESGPRPADRKRERAPAGQAGSQAGRMPGARRLRAQS